MADLEKQKKIHKKGFSQHTFTPKKMGKPPQKNTSFSKLSPLNCQNFQEVANNVLKSEKSEGNT